MGCSSNAYTLPGFGQWLQSGPCMLDGFDYGPANHRDN